MRTLRNSKHGLPKRKFCVYRSWWNSGDVVIILQTSQQTNKSEEPRNFQTSCSAKCECKSVQPCRFHPGHCEIDISSEANHTHINYRLHGRNLQLCVSPKCLSHYLGIICYQCFLEKQTYASQDLTDKMVREWRSQTIDGSHI